MEFEVGDWVICIDANKYRRIENGRFYKIEAINDDILILFPKINGYFKKRFIKAPKSLQIILELNNA